MSVAIERVDDIAILAANGRFIRDEEVKQLETALSQAVDASDCTKILLDMREMEFLRSTTIGVIATTFGRAVRRGKRFCLCNMSRRNQTAFELMKFDSSLRVFDTRAEALEILRTS